MSTPATFMVLAAAPSPFSPASITGLVAWYDASDAASLFTDTGRTTPVSADAQTVKGVTDKSGAGNHLTEATNGPTYKVNIQNGKSVLRFDGINDTLSKASFTQAQPVTAVAVYARAATAAVVALCSRTDGNCAFYFTATVGAQVQAYGGGAFNGGTLSTSWQQMAALMNGASSEIRIGGGASVGSGNALANGFTSNLYVGSINNASNFLNADLGELLLISGPTSLSTLNQLGPYLAAKWGVAWTTAT